MIKHFIQCLKRASFPFRVPVATVPAMTAARASSPSSRPQAEDAETQRPASTAAGPRTRTQTHTRRQTRRFTRSTQSGNIRIPSEGITTSDCPLQQSTTRPAGCPPWVRRSGRATTRPRLHWVRWRGARTASVPWTFTRWLLTAYK